MHMTHVIFSKIQYIFIMVELKPASESSSVEGNENVYRSDHTFGKDPKKCLHNSSNLISINLCNIFCHCFSFILWNAISPPPNIISF